jgi:hypothetical protein
VEINLVMGIVKIALIVLAMVFSACPLPFESVATPEFMAWWYVGVTVVLFCGVGLFPCGAAWWRIWSFGAHLMHIPAALHRGDRA